jgi:hypothetical protein
LPLPVQHISLSLAANIITNLVVASGKTQTQTQNITKIKQKPNRTNCIAITGAEGRQKPTLKQ